MSNDTVGTKGVIHNPIAARMVFTGSQYEHSTELHYVLMTEINEACQAISRIPLLTRQDWRALARQLAAFLSVAVLLIMIPTAHAYVSPATGTSYPGQVTRPYEHPEHRYAPGHRGVDINLPALAPVVAAEDGVVAFAGVAVGVPTVSIQHADGIRTTYQPVLASVSEGQLVSSGESIGFLVTHPRHEGLHWGARIGKKDYINPLSLLKRADIRLKPIGNMPEVKHADVLD